MRRCFSPTAARRLLLVVPILMLWAVVATAAPWRVVSSDEQALRLEIVPGDPVWREVVREDGRVFATAHIDGFAPAGVPAGPRIPVAGGWLVVPPGHRAELKVVSEAWRDVEPRLLAPTPTPVMREGEEGGRPILADEFLLQGEEPRSGSGVLTPEQRSDLAASLDGGAWELGAPTAWRGRRVAPLRIRPLGVDAAGRAVRVLERAVLEVEFVRDDAVKTTAAPGRADDRFSSLLINGDLLGTLSADPAVRPASSFGPVKRTQRRGTLLQPEVRLPVTKTRLHRIDASTLDAAGLLDLDGVGEDQIRLYQRRAVDGTPGVYEEIEVPILMVGEGDDFSGADHFVFWGLRARDDVAFTDADGDHLANVDTEEQYSPSTIDPVSGGNIYFLAVAEPDAGEAWARMDVQSLGAASAAPETSYRRTDYHEEDTHHRYAPNATADDRYHWNAVRASEARVPVGAKSPVPGRADVRIRVGGFGVGTSLRDFSLALDDGTGPSVFGELANVTHTGRVYDSNLSGDTVWSDWLVDADLVMDSTGTSALILGYLDWFEVEYEAAYAAVNDALDFHLGAGTGVRHVEVTGFGGDQLHLFDVSDPRNPEAVALNAANVVDAGDDTWTLSIAGNQSAPAARRFMAVEGPLSQAIPTFQYFRASRVTTVDDPTAVAGPFDVLVITHTEFREEADRWVQYRTGRGGDPVAIHVVESQQVFDWFSGGMKHPDALKAMVDHALENWGVWAVQIFGDAYQNVRSLSEEDGTRDFVPSRWHAWTNGSYPRELLASDSWFVTPDATDAYPDEIGAPLPEAAIARFPGNSTDEIATMIDKVMAYEASDGDWKRRAVLLADDAWSDGYQSQGSTQEPDGLEQRFESSQNALAGRWENAGGVNGDWIEGLDAARVFLGDYLDPLCEGLVERPLRDFQDHAEELVRPVMLSEIGRGGTLVHYQGHANDYTMAHERMIVDYGFIDRRDIAGFSNDGKPFVFVGLGCHIATWARDRTEDTVYDYPSLAEKMLRRTNAGAMATYASGGYEFLLTNERYAGVMGNVWLDHPPRGDDGRSRWVLGELFLATNLEFLGGAADLLSKRLVAQYALLGDVLTTLDAAPPRARVLVDWEPVAEGAELKARDASNELVLTVEAFDEAGVDRLVVLDGDGDPVSATITGGTPEGAEDDQFATWDVRLPLTADDRTIVFHVYDTADLDDDAPHTEFSVSTPTTVTLYTGGAQYIPGESPLPGGDPEPFTGRVVTSAFVDTEAVLHLTATDAEVSNAVLTRADDHAVDMAFDLAVTGAEPVLTLAIGDMAVVIPLSGTAPTGSGIYDLAVFPNPVGDDARFMFRTDAGVSGGRLHVYSVAGHRIATLPVSASDFRGGGRVIVDWDGRDDEGDRPANGTYLYRVELDAAAGRVASGMERLVMMR